MAQRERPLSPFMHYRWQYTMRLSILHRLTGVFMSAGIVLLVFWLASIASGADAYDSALKCLSSPLTKLVMFGWLAAFYYHLCNGIRHLFWDMGHGFEKAVAKKTGTVVVVITIVMTVLTWWCISSRITASVAGGLV
jgi:succinate dehydrogenase / fumarate reductase, cytochrome b subunit